MVPEGHALQHCIQLLQLPHVDLGYCLVLVWCMSANRRTCQDLSRQAMVLSRFKQLSHPSGTGLVR